MNSTAPETAWKVDALGTWTAEREFMVEADRTIAYAKATNDENPRHLSGEVAPPLFAIVPPFPQLGEPTLAGSCRQSS